jgi:hypothetical protein
MKDGVKHRKKLAERKLNTVPIRVTDEQKRRFALAAKAAGVDNVSTWLRMLGEHDAKNRGIE